jgi:hypothetical protein
MLFNKLILYCITHEQAMLWDACKTRRCSASSCLFKKIVKNYGENLWTKTPLRIASLEDVKERLEELTKPIPLIRTPIIDEPPLEHTPLLVKTEEKATPAPPIREPAFSSVGDILREAIKDAVKAAM